MKYLRCDFKALNNCIELNLLVFYKVSQMKDRKPTAETINP